MLFKFAFSCVTFTSYSWSDMKKTGEEGRFHKHLTSQASSVSSFRRQKSDCVMANFNYGLTASYSSVEDNTCQLKSGFGDAETSVYRDSRSSIVYPDCGNCAQRKKKQR